jgi:hypothetical protein
MTTLAEFYQGELEFHKAQKKYIEERIRTIKRNTDLEIRGLHKEIDQIEIVMAELQKFLAKEQEFEEAPLVSP